MGTRGFVGFVAEGREVIAYQQFDSYPSGVGVDTLRWLRSANLDVVAQRVAQALAATSLMITAWVPKSA